MEFSLVFRRMAHAVYRILQDRFAIGRKRRNARGKPSWQDEIAVCTP